MLTQICRDSRIKALISNGMQEKKRSFFVVVGDRSKDTIVYLHHIMTNANIKHNKSVLWAYKNKLLGFTRYENLLGQFFQLNVFAHRILQ